MKNIIYIVLMLPLFAFSGSITIDTPSQLQSALDRVNPGDTILLQAVRGWSDVHLHLKAQGSPQHPVVITTVDDKPLFLEGNSSLSIAGDYLHIKNFYFRNGYTVKNDVITFRINDTLANHCTIENFVIDHFNKPNRFDQDSWIVLWGQRNRIVHSTFRGKINTGPVLIIELANTESRANYHVIQNNHFQDRYRLGSNGGETIRIGVSRYSIYDSNTQLIDNYFEHCSGETEIVSIKSGANYIARNYFYECEGSLVLRHGDGNMVDGNFFDGNLKKETGGIRVVNAGHIIKNNTLKDLRGKGFRAPLVVMHGVPNSLVNRYMPVHDVVIQNNTFINSEHLVFDGGKDNERTVAPKDILFSGNKFVNYKKPYFQGTENPGITILDTQISPSIALDPIPLASFGSSFTSFKKEEINIRPVRHIVDDIDKLAEVIRIANKNDTLLLQFATAVVGLSAPITIDKPLIIRGAEQYTFVSHSSKALPAFFILVDQGALKIENIHFQGTFPNYAAVRTGITTQMGGVLSSYTLHVKKCIFSEFNESSNAGIKAEKKSFADTVIVEDCVFYRISGNGIAYNAEKEDKGIYNVEHILVKNCVFSNILNSAIDIYRGGNDESTTGPAVEIYNCTFNNVDNKEQGAAVRLIGAQYIRFIHNNVFGSGQGGRSIECRDFRYHDVKITDSNFFESGKIDVFYAQHIGDNTSKPPMMMHHTLWNEDIPKSFRNNEIIGSYELL